jgi:hypothetical protein
LVAHRLRSSGYKKPEDVSARREIIAALGSRIQGVGQFPVAVDNADTLDAIVCVLAAQDFLEGRAMSPQDMALAQREGWIWAAAPSFVKPNNELTKAAVR